MCRTFKDACYLGFGICGIEDARDKQLLSRAISRL